MLGSVLGYYTGGLGFNCHCRLSGFYLAIPPHKVMANQQVVYLLTKASLLNHSKPVLHYRPCIPVKESIHTHHEYIQRGHWSYLRAECFKKKIK